MPEEYEDLRIEAPSRACDACRKMKIKCIDKENPPCKRCRHMKLQCRFAMAPVPRVVLEEQEATKGRLEQLEGHVSGIYQKLDEMSSILVRLASGGGGPSGSGGSGAMPTPSAASGVGDGAGAMSISPRPAMTTRDSGPVHRASTASAPPTVEHHRSAEYPLHMGPATGSSSTPWSRDDYVSAPPDVASSIPGFVPQPNILNGPIMPEPSAMADGDGDQDILVGAIEGEPFRHFTTRGQASSLQSQRRGSHTAGSHPPLSWGSVDGMSRKSKSRNGSISYGSGSKRRRTDATEYEDDFDLAGTADWGVLPLPQKADALRGSSDPVDLGYMSEEEGISLFNAFFKYAHPFIPILDPREDTWEKLKKRSPFIVTVILLTALRQREKSGQPSDLSKRLQEQVERMTKLTLFSPTSSLETVQGLAILVSYSEHAWRTCCHAMALAVDMRLYRCLPYLHKIRTDSRKPHHMLEKQRPLVVGARLWLALVRLAYEISYNHALPVLFPSQGGKRTQYARELLDHPLSTLYDSRLVVSVEMCEVREPAFLPYESVAAHNPLEMDDLLRKANLGIHELYGYWLGFYERVGLPPDDFLRIELEHQKAYAIMFTNSPAWYGVHTKGDVAHLSADRKQWVSAAMRSAAFLVSSVANKRLEKDSEFGNHNFHVGIVATARYLIRMAELLPDVGDLHQISLDIDRLLLKLPHYPAGPFVDGLRRTVTKARTGGVLPYTRLSEAAARTAGSASTSPPAMDPMSIYPGFNPFPWNDPVQTSSGPAHSPTTFMTEAESVMVSGLPVDIDGTVAGLTPLPQPLVDVQLPEDLNLSTWFPAPDDFSALDADMANWFPAAPQVWLEDEE